MIHDVLVLGGGISGLTTLEALSRRTDAGRVALLERFELGHTHGSSHGRTRIARAAYHHPLYARLYTRARAEEWPRLERDAETVLLHPTPGCVHGPAGGLVEQYQATCETAGVDVERLDLRTARRRFPMFRIDETTGVLDDRTACVIAAADTLDALLRLALERGAEVHANTRCTAIDRDGETIRVHTDRGEFETRRLVVTAGSWTRELIPAAAARLTCVRQAVGYFDLDLPPGASQVGRFPVWIHLGHRSTEVHYGLPAFQRPGVKAARHSIEPAGAAQDDPEPLEGLPREAELDELRAWFQERLHVPIRGVTGSERCLYTMTATEDFVLSALPDDPRVVVGSGLSGHGFKFGPLLGRLLAELSLDGTTTVPEFEAGRAQLAL